MSADNFGHRRITGQDGTFAGRIKYGALWCIGAYDSANRWTLESRLSSAEIEATLLPLVNSNIFGKYQGRVSRSGFEISIFHWWVHNSWWPILYGKVEEIPGFDGRSGGCKITTYLQVRPITLWFMATFMVFAVFIAITSLWQNFAVEHRTTLAVCFPLFFPIYGIGLARFCRLMSKADEPKLMEIVERLKRLDLGIQPPD
ncbi:MAG: hypothetical protein JST01_11340 [Cyanobacteria bacterium SZAS TMP-1]|nr:hypothetical protein [Cyanobacteria bacterium SZAS TMP-1]